MEIKEYLYPDGKKMINNNNESYPSHTHSHIFVIDQYPNFFLIHLAAEGGGRGRVQKEYLLGLQSRI